MNLKAILFIGLASFWSHIATAGQVVNCNINRHVCTVYITGAKVGTKVKIKSDVDGTTLLYGKVIKKAGNKARVKVLRVDKKVNPKKGDSVVRIKDIQSSADEYAAAFSAE